MLNSNTKTMLLRHDRTEPEEVLLLYILLFLKKIGYSGEIHCRCFLANQSGQARRPDLYLPRYALAIEIDGATRDAWHRRQADLLPRDEFYTSIGANPPLRIPATWVSSQFKMDRFLHELQKMLHENRVSPRLRATINKRICDGRKMVAIKNPGLFQSSGSLAPQFCEELKNQKFKEFRHFGGTKFILRGKYKINPFRNFSIQAHIDELLKRVKERNRERNENNSTKSIGT